MIVAFLDHIHLPFIYTDYKTGLHMKIRIPYCKFLFRTLIKIDIDTISITVDLLFCIAFVLEVCGAG